MAKKLNDEVLEIESVKINSIKKHPRNARLHDEENIQAVMRSLETFGQRTPLVVGKKSFILKGNGTHEAALRLGWKTIQITRVLHLSPEDEEAYALADNKTSDLSEFDFSTVAGIMHDLKESGIDLSVTGFREFETESLLDAEFDPGEPGQLPGHPGEESLKIVFTGESFKQASAVIKKARALLWDDDEKDEDVILNILVDWANLRIPKKKVKKLGRKGKA